MGSISVHAFLNVWRSFLRRAAVPNVECVVRISRGYAFPDKRAREPPDGGRGRDGRGGGRFAGGLGGT